MAANNGIFVDSNYLIALYNTTDSLHTRAKELARKIASTDSQLYLSNYIILEVLTVLSQRIGRQEAIDIGQMLRQAPQIELIYIDEDLNELSWQIFKASSGKNTSFVDCSILACLRYTGIKHLLSFDTTDFKPLTKQFGFKLYT